MPVAEIPVHSLNSPRDSFGRRWLWRLNRRLARGRALTHAVVCVGLIGAVGYADLLSGHELSLSIFYLLPVAYAAWFLGGGAGLIAAMVSAVVWFVVETTNQQVYTHPWVPVWNAGVRLGFFFVGVLGVTLVRRTEVRLTRNFFRQNRALRQEIVRRRRLEGEIVAIAAREQARLARDVHDGVGQYLAAMAFHVRMLRDDLRQQCPGLLTQADRLAELVRETNQATRRLDRALPVQGAASGDLVAALRPLVGEHQELTSVHCTLTAAPDVITLDEFRILMLFRIVQEALSNAVKYANPTAVHVQAAASESSVSVRVTNDGTAIGPTATSHAGSGHRIMKLRAELCGGTVTFGPTSDDGFAVTCVVPRPGNRPPEIPPHAAIQDDSPHARTDRR